MTPHERIPFDVAKLVRRSTSGRCFICEFLKADPAYDHVRVTETDTAIVFLNKFPTLFGYVIVAPKRHVERVTGDFTQDEYVELQRLGYKIVPSLRRVLARSRM